MTVDSSNDATCSAVDIKPQFGPNLTIGVTIADIFNRNASIEIDKFPFTVHSTSENDRQKYCNK